MSKERQALADRRHRARMGVDTWALGRLKAQANADVTLVLRLLAGLPAWLALYAIDQVDRVLNQSRLSSEGT